MMDAIAIIASKAEDTANMPQAMAVVVDLLDKTKTKEGVSVFKYFTGKKNQERKYMEP
jgi:hypothetical protein